MQDLNSLISQYFNLRKEIHEAFGYQEDWVIISMEDRRKSYWHCTATKDNEEGEVLYHETPLTGKLVREGNHYEDEIYCQRFLPKYIYRTSILTLICVDTHTDGNKLLAIFSNDREIKEIL